MGGEGQAVWRRATVIGRWLSSRFQARDPREVAPRRSSSQQDSAPRRSSSQQDSILNFSLIAS